MIDSDFRALLNEKRNALSSELKPFDPYRCFPELCAERDERANRFKKWKNRGKPKDTKTSSSTLSLHIAAYENSVEAANEAKDSPETALNVPRQSNESIPTHEMMKYTSLRKLFNPRDNAEEEGPPAKKLCLEPVAAAREQAETLEIIQHDFSTFSISGGIDDDSEMLANYRQSDETYDEDELDQSAAFLMREEESIPNDQTNSDGIQSNQALSTVGARMLANYRDSDDDDEEAAEKIVEEESDENNEENDLAENVQEDIAEPVNTRTTGFYIYIRTKQNELDELFKDENPKMFKNTFYSKCWANLESEEKEAFKETARKINLEQKKKLKEARKPISPRKLRSRRIE